MLFGVEQALRWQQFEHTDLGAKGPTVRRGALAKLVFRLGQRNVERLFASFCALKQELQRNRGLARSGFALQQEDMTPRQTALKNIVQAGDARRRLG